MRALLRGSAAVVLMGILAGCGGGGGERGGRGPATGSPNGEQAAQQPALAVEALEVSRGSLLQTIQASGSIRGSQEVGVVSEVEGRIQAASFELGQFVEAGQVLLQVESTVARLNVQEAQGALDSARLDLSATERRFEQGSASQAELTRARSAANGAEARYEAALKTLRDHTITAPISGFIASRADDLSVGNYLNRGVPVTRIVDLTTLEMEIAVGERELQYLEVGLPASVSISACGSQSVGARVDSIAAGADPSTGSFPVLLSWENDCDTARSGMTASASVRTADAAPALVVPSAAIREDSGGRYVFVARDGEVERRTITTGERLGDRVTVLDGLTEGDVIVTSALSALDDGAVVEATVRGRTGDVL
mgnify:CR=1 FL=1